MNNGYILSDNSKMEEHGKAKNSPRTLIVCSLCAQERPQTYVKWPKKR